jgi:arylsulfatase A-like enzyme/Flp pilus assembly protein TadD
MMEKKWRIAHGERWLLLTLVAALSLAGCGKTAARKTNVLLITMDTTRADKLGAYGCRDIRTPVIDGLAREGVLFTDARASIPITLPSHCTIMTGLYSPGHGVRNNGNYVLPGEISTLAEVLSREGYHTAAFVGAFVLDSQFGLSQGFDTYDDSFRERGKSASDYFGHVEKPAGDLTQDALGWLATAGEPFFLWLHYYDPHYPYLPPAPFDTLFAQPYLGEIAYVDSCIGEVVKSLEAGGLAERLLVVLTSDHGESLGEHGELSHGLFLYEGTTRVPLIMKFEGRLPAGARVSHPVSLADLFPTVLDIGEIAIPAEVQGRSLLTTLESPETAGPPMYMETVLPSENFGWSEITGVFHDGWKYFRVTEPELYNVSEDPREEKNLFHAEKETVKEMESLLDSLHTALARETAGSAASGLDAETQEKLEMLGYVRAAAQGGAGGGVDPKRMVQVVNRLDYGMYLVTTQDYMGAIRVFEEVLSIDPENLTAHNFLGASLLNVGRESEALYHWRKVIELNPGNIDAHRNLATALGGRGLLEEARREFETVLRLNPSDVRSLIGLGNISMTESDTLAALEYLEKALRIDQDLPRAHLLLGQIDEKRGDRTAALLSFEKAVALDSTSVEAREALAKTLRSAGRGEEAVPHFAWVAEAKEDAASYVALAVTLDRLGRLEEAVENFEKALAADSLSVEAHNGMGISLLALGRHDESEKSFLRAVSLAPEFAEPWYNLGNLYRKIGRREDAIASYTKFLDLWKGREEVRERAASALESVKAEGAPHQ